MIQWLITKFCYATRLETKSPSGSRLERKKLDATETGSTHSSRVVDAPGIKNQIPDPWY